jgi:hypothetical protein
VKLGVRGWEIMRRLFSIVVGVAAVLSAATGLLEFGSSKLIDDTVQHSHEIDGAFRGAAGFVSAWRRDHGRLPSRSEFEAWASTQQDRAYSPTDIQYIVGSFPEDIVREFGPPADDAYLFTFWRGEWNEYYASWADRSSLSFDPSEYFIFGSKWLDLLAFGAAGAALAGVAFAMWPNQPLQPTRATEPTGKQEPPGSGPRA